MTAWTLDGEPLADGDQLAAALAFLRDVQDRGADTAWHGSVPWEDVVPGLVVLALRHDVIGRERDTSPDAVAALAYAARRGTPAELATALDVYGLTPGTAARSAAGDHR